MNLFEHVFSQIMERRDPIVWKPWWAHHYVRNYYTKYIFGAGCGVGMRRL
jgi:hypothetical protein